MGEYGKPFFKSLPLHFSLSHSGLYAACTLAAFPIGLDIQQIRKYSPAFAARFFSPEEQEIVEKAADKDIEFSRVWSAKESALKYLGIGLNRSLSSVIVSNEDSVRLLPENVSLKLKFYIHEDYILSLCAESFEDNFDLSLVKIQ